MNTRRVGPGARTGEDGAVIVFVALAMVALLGFGALVIDFGRARVVRSELQTAADSAALAAARALPDAAAAQAIAETYANLNSGGAGAVTSAPDIVVGHWDASTAIFTPSGSPTNAVQIVTRRADVYGNPVTNFFAGIGGFDETDVSAIAISAKKRSVIDFEGLPEGAFPTSVSVGNGVSGDPVPGDVGVSGRGGYGPQIFDGLCLPAGSSDPTQSSPANCTGGDSDLYSPGQGNIMIVAENNDPTDPDDLGACSNGSSPPSWVAEPADVPNTTNTKCTLIFDFRNFGTGTVTVSDVTLIDVEEDAFVWLYRDGVLVGEVALADVGDGQVANRPVPGSPQVDIMVVKFQGSGAVDNIGYSETISLVG